MSKVLVTGGAGFIGSHVVDKLIAAGHEAVIYDVRPSPWHGADVEFISGDVCDVQALTIALQGCDAVAHLAAAADVNEVQKDPVRSEELNARGTLAVLEAARNAAVARVVYASTIWVYSDVVDVETVNEDQPLCPPAHLYTATKLAGELYCRSYKELYDLDSTILRFGIPYGPRARPAAVIPAFVGKALRGEPLTIAGDGLQSRRFVYVEDLAEGVVSGLAPCAANRTYNLVSTEDVTIRDIAETVREEIGDVEVVYTPGRSADFKGAEVCGGRAADELAWHAHTPFREGVQRYIAWYREDADKTAAAEGSAVAAAGPSTAGEGPSATPAQQGPRPYWQRQPGTVLAFAVIAVLAFLAGRQEPIGDIARTVLFALIASALPALALAREWRGRARMAIVTGCWGVVLFCVLATIRHMPGHHTAHAHPVLMAFVIVSAGVSAIAVSMGWSDSLREQFSTTH